VDDLVQALGLEGVSKSEVSRICQELDEKMAQFRNRPLDGEYPYVWLDAKAVKTRENDRVVNMAAVVAVGVRTTGDREVLGFDLGPAETYQFWVTFLRSLVRRGLRGVRLVISDAHEGLTGHRRGAARGGLAAVSGTLHAQPAELCPQAGPVHGGGAGPDGFRPA